MGLIRQHGVDCYKNRCAFYNIFCQIIVSVIVQKILGCKNAMESWRMLLQDFFLMAKR